MVSLWVRGGGRLEGCPFMFNVDLMEGKKWKSVQWYQIVKPSFKTFLFVYSCKLG